MGRIAEALKRAEDERRRRQAIDDVPASAEVATPGGGAATAVLEPPPAAAAAAAAAKIQAPSVRYRSDVSEHPRPVLPCGAGIDEAVLPYYDRSSIISEQYRSLRTRLLTQNPQNDHRVLAITSAIPREGKSVTTLNLGVIMAEIRHLKVLCVDADFRRSKLAKLLGTKNEPGLADLLQGEATYEEVVQPTPIQNLYFVSAGATRGRSAAELLSLQRTGAIVRRFQSEFHYTIIDTPPATTVTDVGIVGQFCNGVIMLVRLNYTPEPAARRAVRLLQVNNIPIMGCVLVGSDERSGEYGYSYNYYYRYYHGRERTVR